MTDYKNGAGSFRIRQWAVEVRAHGGWRKHEPITLDLNQ